MENVDSNKYETRAFEICFECKWVTIVGSTAQSRAKECIRTKILKVPRRKERKLRAWHALRAGEPPQGREFGSVNFFFLLLLILR